MPPEHKFCPECGVSLVQFSKYCPECGTPLNSSPSQPPTDVPLPVVLLNESAFQPGVEKRLCRLRKAVDSGEIDKTWASDLEQVIQTYKQDNILIHLFKIIALKTIAGIGWGAVVGAFFGYGISGQLQGALVNGLLAATATGGLRALGAIKYTFDLRRFGIPSSAPALQMISGSDKLGMFLALMTAVAVGILFVKTT